jgi:hypothetical protein
MEKALSQRGVAECWFFWHRPLYVGRVASYWLAEIAIDKGA